MLVGVLFFFLTLKVENFLLVINFAVIFHIPLVQKKKVKAQRLADLRSFNGKNFKINPVINNHDALDFCTARSNSVESH
jgi:hypothetical protein